ncbi:hypothetical protein SK128_023953 [Halocaridina rubra]|uniref:Uncharacterized protein n=1 Tax=Halocaridina rubra TaxID=373956 RepID=A0AAN8WU17_HALRR
MASNTYQYSEEEIRFIKLSFMIRKCLQDGTEKLADRDKFTQWKAGNENIESMITELKDLRNEVSHEVKKYTEKEFLDETDKLKKLLENILNHIGTIYSIDVHQNVQDMKKELNNYRDKAVEDEELTICKHNRQCKIMKTKGKDDIKKMIRKNKEGAVNPVNHVVDMSINVKDVFSEMKIKVTRTVEEVILYENILLDIKGEGTNPSTVIIGCAGAGKTTIVRKILYEFDSGIFTVKGLERYDIVLHHECRNMSTAKLFDEVINLKKTHELIIITTRPEKLSYLRNRLKSENFEEITLLGIPHERRAAFVKNYYIKLAEKEDLKNKPIDQLFNYLEKYEFILDRILSLPYNLVLIIILYCHTDLIFDEITTAPVLYRENYLLCRTKLAERLRVCESTRSWEESKIKWVIDKFLYELAKVSLIGLLNDQINLSSEVYQRLTTVCNVFSVPVEHMASAFLTPKYTGSSEILYSFPHKGIREYFAARYIWMQLTERYLSSEYHNLCAQMSITLSSYSVPPALQDKIMQGVQKKLKKH